MLSASSRTGDLAKKTILVSGAGSGLGQACARLAAGEGANLVLGDLNAERLEATAAELSDGGAPVETLVMDVRQPDDCAALARRAVDVFGQLDGAVCSAGIDNVCGTLEMTLEQWQGLLAVNLTGTFLTAQAAARVMAEKGNPGSIVTLASGIAVRGRAQGAHYAAAKAGVIGLTKSFALDLAKRGIRVNAVAPGLVNTPMAQDVMTAEQIQARGREIPLGRIGRPNDIAQVVLFLLADASGWLTGQTLHANGGGLMP